VPKLPRKAKAVAAAVGAALVAGLAALGSRTTRKPGRPYASLDGLQPAFRARVQELLANMRARGFDPLVWETYRDPARGEKLNAKQGGVLVGASMHCLGLAADIVDAKRRWAAPDFFTALGEEAERIGLVWGGRFKNPDGSEGRDRPHVQAIPIEAQQAARTLTTAAELDALARQYIG